MATHASFVPAAPHALDTTTDLEIWATQFPWVHIDVGTGDGTYAIRLARSSPGTAVIGLDTSLDHLRGSRRRYPVNLRFIQRDACRHADGRLPPATMVTINFPYGSLLRGLVDGDLGMMAGLDAILADAGRIEVRVNLMAFVATGLDPDRGPAAIMRNLQRIDSLDVEMRDLGQDELRAFPSSWAKRLGFGSEAGAVLVRGTRRGRGQQ